MHHKLKNSLLQIIPRGKARLFAQVLLGIAGFAAGYFLATSIFGRGHVYPGDLSCVTKRETRLVHGDSLQGVLNAGDKIRILYGYYDCNEPAIGDTVAFFYGGSEEPLVKIIKALPGDSFSLEPRITHWRILVNGEPVKNSEGEEYQVGTDRYPRFSLYEKDYGKEIPPDTYMLLSNVAGDSVDSRAFGLASRKDILGRIFLWYP